MTRALAVLLASARPIDAAAVGRAIAPVLDVHPLDAARRARRSGGLVLEQAEPALARDVVLALERAGIAALVVPAESVPARLRGRRVAAVSVLDQALGLVLPAEPERIEVAWDDVALVLAHAVEVEEPPGAAPRARPPEPGILLAGERSGLSPATIRLLDGIARHRRESRRGLRLGVDVVLRGGLRSFRLGRETLASIAPGEIVAAAPQHSLEVLLALGRALVARATAALRCAESELLLAEGLLEPALFIDVDELDRYERWTIARAAAAATST